MRRFGLLLASVVTAAFAGFAAAQPAPGDLAPDALGRSRNGDDITLSAYRGKVVAVTFWASWCAPCQQELPLLDKLQRLVGGDHLRVVAINIEDREHFRRATGTMVDWSIVIGNDPYQDRARKFGVKGIPHLVIVGRDGRVRQVHRGYNEEKVPTIVRAVADAINE